MKNKGLIAIIVVLVAVIITLVAVVFLMQMPTIVSVGDIKKIISNESTTDEMIDFTTEPIVETTIQLPKVTTKIETYTGYNDHVYISYPQIDGMSDYETQEKLNNKIKTNAISIVPLYPVSTAIQYLTINCEVKSFDENFITILYEGDLVGSSVKNGTNSSNNSSGNGSNTPKNNSSVPDPYLDGFVDPLEAFGQNIWQQNFQQSIIQQNIQFNNQQTTNSNDSTVVIRGNQNTSNPKPQQYGTNTSDSGPTPVDIKSPTAPAKYSSQVVEDNFSYNNPINSVSGFTGTNLVGDASTISQKIFYTNTINLKTGLDVYLNDYVDDLSALARYIRSSKVQFINIDDEDKKDVRDYINRTILSKLTTNLKEADFRNEGVKSWPKIFSYKDDDDIVYISVRLSSKLGNYAIVKYEK